MKDAANGSATEAVLAKIRALAPTVNAGLSRMDRECRLTPEVVDGLIATGLFRASVPRAYDGLELDPVSQTRLVEACSRLDGSVGWIAMIGVVGGHIAASLPPAVAREFFARDDAICAGQGFSVGQRADVVPGGWRVSGRFTFGSGVCHARMMFFSVGLYENGQPVLTANGTPRTRILVTSASNVRIIETWDTLGMRGTGSHDFTMENLFVPTDYSFDMGQVPRVDAPLYKAPALPISYQAGVPLGIARAALDEAHALCRTKRVIPGNHLLQDDPRTQECIGRAETNLAAARNYIFDVLTDAWATLSAGQPLSPEQRTACRMTLVHAHEAGRKVVDSMVNLAATSSLGRSSVLERALRDIITASQHRQVHPRHYAGGGRAYLGVSQEF